MFVDLDTVLAAPAGPERGRHPLPDPEAFAASLGQLGIGGGDTVVAYDDDGGVIAARLVWMLRATGHEAAVLDGGIDAWDGSLEAGPSERAAAEFAASEWPRELIATIDEVADAGEAVLLDARDRDRYSGAFEPADPRAGHIPGARSLPVREHAGPDGRLPAPEELRERLRAAGVGDESAVISYCGSGVTACHNLLVLEHAGMRPGRLYPGSWSQWSADPSRPAETGASAAAAGPADR